MFLNVTDDLKIIFCRTLRQAQCLAKKAPANSAGAFCLIKPMLRQAQHAESGDITELGKASHAELAEALFS